MTQATERERGSAPAGAPDAARERAAALPLAPMAEAASGPSAAGAAVSGASWAHGSSGAARPAPDAPKLEVQGLSLSWDGRPVVADVSLEVRPGRLACLVGRSGTGKTTLFHAIAGLTAPDAGRILLDGRDVTGRPGSIGYMLQKDLLLPEHRVLDNVALPLRLAGVPKARARSQAQERFAEFGLAGTERLYPSQLSGGMRQRAALLRTSLSGADTLLLDEPFSALDALTRADLRQWFLGQVERLGLTGLLVTHDVDEAVALADEVLVLAPSRAAGGAATIVGRVAVDVPRADRAGLMLTEKALHLKAAVLRLLGEDW